MAFLNNLGNSSIVKPILNQLKSEILNKTMGRNTITLATSFVSRSHQIDSKPVLTIQEVTKELTKQMGIKSRHSPIQESRSYLNEYLPKNQAELEPRSMQDSFTSAIIPLSTNDELQNKYITFSGSVRLGRLLEDMDIFAVWVVHKHIKNPKQKPGISFPYCLVTLLVDQIDFTDFKPSPIADIRFSGHVSWVGKSSVEVAVWLEQMHDNKLHKLTRALFLMVARDATNTHAAIVNAINPANEEEKKILSGGEDRQKRRIALQKQSLLKVIPSDKENKIIHDLFIRTMPPNEFSLLKCILPAGCIWMESCTLSNMILSHPENRNANNTVYGGFLMRHAVEISWSLAYLSSKHVPVLKNISDIRFHKPIDVNSMIRMHALIAYTNKEYIQVTVYVESFKASSGIHYSTNAFHFTYKMPELITEVIPKTYHEAIMYLDGRRHFLNATSHQIADNITT